MSIDRTADWTLWKDQQELNAAGYTVAELPGSDSSQSQDLELCNVKDEQPHVNSIRGLNLHSQTQPFGSIFHTSSSQLTPYPVPQRGNLSVSSNSHIGISPSTSAANAQPSYVDVNPSSSSSNAAASSAIPPTRNISRYSQLVQLKMKNVLLAQDGGGGASSSASNVDGANCNEGGGREDPVWNQDGVTPWSVLNGIAQEHVARLAAHPQPVYQPQPQQTEWYEPKGPMYSAWSQNTSYDNQHPVFDSGLSTYTAYHPAAANQFAFMDLPEQQGQHIRGSFNGFWDGDGSSFTTGPNPSISNHHSAVDPNSNAQGSTSTPNPTFDIAPASAPRSAMVELSRYQQLLAAKFPAQRVRADGTSGLTRSPRPGLYASNLPDTAQQPRSSPSALSNSSLAPHDQSTSTAGPSYTDRSHQSDGSNNNGKTLSPYGNDASTYPTLEHVQHGHFSNHPTSYHSFNPAEQPAASSSSFSPSPSQAFLDMPNQTSLLSFAGNKFDPYSPGPFGVGCGAGDSPLVQLNSRGQHVPEEVPPTSWPSTSNGAGGASTQSSLQGVSNTQQSDTSAQWMANHSSSSSSASLYLRPGSFSSHGQLQSVDQSPSAYSSNQGVSSATYRHSLSYNSTSDDMHDPAGDRRHHSASALQPNAQSSTSTFDFTTAYNTEAFNAPPSAYYPTALLREAYVDTLSNGPSPGSQPSWMTMPAEVGPSSITTSYAAPGPSTVPAEAGPNPNPGILPPPSVKMEKMQATKKAQELEPELSAVAKGKRPAVDKKEPKLTSTTAPPTEVVDSAAEPGGPDKAGEVKKAPLACHFCRGRKLKCDGIRPTCSNCAKRNRDCTVDAVIRRRGPGKKKKERSQRGSTAATRDTSQPAHASSAGAGRVGVYPHSPSQGGSMRPPPAPPPHQGPPTGFGQASTVPHAQTIYHQPSLQPPPSNMGSYGNHYQY